MLGFDSFALNLQQKCGFGGDLGQNYRHSYAQNFQGGIYNEEDVGNGDGAAAHAGLDGL